MSPRIRLQWLQVGVEHDLTGFSVGYPWRHDSTVVLDGLNWFGGTQSRLNLDRTQWNPCCQVDSVNGKYARLDQMDAVNEFPGLRRPLLYPG